MVALEVHGGELIGVARQLADAASQLAAVGASPPVHPPVASDEVSVSAAARLTEHGAVLASRAGDGAAVLTSAAQAILQALGAYQRTEEANTQVVALRGNAGPATVAFTPAATVNAPAPIAPIAPPAPRSGKATAALIEAGKSSAGSGFASGCEQHAAAFRHAAETARSASSTVRSALTGKAGPILADALQRFGSWADSMGSHATTVRGSSQGHEERFTSTQGRTPKTQQFTAVEKQIDEATRLNNSPGTRGMYTGVITGLQAKLKALGGQAGAAVSSYHLWELPAAPPGPPPVIPIIGGGGGNTHAPTAGTGASTRDEQTPSKPVGSPAEQAAAEGGQGAAAGAELGDGEFGGAGQGIDGLGMGAQGGPTDQMGQMVQAFPSLIAGVVGGLAGIPAALAQQVQSVGSQATQALSGLANEMGKSDLDTGGLSTSGLGDGFTSGGGSGSGGGGGGGDTSPAAGSGAASPSGTGMMSLSGGGSTAPVAGPLSAGHSAAAGAGATAGGGPGMMMPPMGGMGAGGHGGGGTKPVRDPDKKVHVPEVPNSESVRGEVDRRAVGRAEAPENPGKPGSETVAAAPTASAGPSITSRRRSNTVLNDKDGQTNG
ncbi:PE family protein [Mycobacteroides abscessus]|uniref:PE family protein n=1 Tax=Mycobacteroides abscessus TaxID=36809 RepID=UPI0009283E93|nr:PE family protein [Mycobacteroides abscessus]SIK92027.1 Uncharacterised protein [Mycobacteroides abscessus subsp. abscessus]SIN02700.1 Uncharacterised protein [Mycobacteroides abscessus subsp. abscessus]SIN09961.1 Uncharacterised protein [Mycobacteroides abscessus subsp. abscessus]